VLDHHDGRWEGGFRAKGLRLVKLDFQKETGSSKFTHLGVAMYARSIRGILFSGLMLGLLVASSSIGRADWIFDKSYFTNSPKTGERVDQYQAIKPVYRVPYSKYFSPDGPHPFMPYGYYADQYGYGGLLGGPYLYSGAFAPNAMPYGGWFGY